MTTTGGITYCQTESCREYKAGVRCGCGIDHKVKPFSTSLVHFQGRHWVLECLARHLVKKVESDHRRRRKELRLMRLIPCSFCDQPAGAGFTRVTGGVVCRRCQQDAGGEG